MNLPKIVVIGVVASILMVSTPVRAGDTDLNTLYLPAIRDNPRCTPVAPTPFGVQLYWDTGKSSIFYPFLLESGARWVRTSIDWAKVEPVNVTPDLYNWEHPDRAVGAPVFTTGGKLVGMVYGVGGPTTLVLPIEQILDELDVELVK